MKWRNPLRETTLLIAAGLGCEKIGKIRLDIGFKGSSMDSYDFTPLHRAIRGRINAVVQTMLEVGAGVLGQYLPLH